MGQQLYEPPSVEMRTCVKLQRLRDPVARDAGSEKCAGIGHCKSTAGSHFDLAPRALENPRVMTMGQRLAVLNTLVIGEIAGMFRQTSTLQIGRSRASQDSSLRRAFSLTFPAGASVLFIHWRGGSRAARRAGDFFFME